MAAAASSTASSTALDAGGAAASSSAVGLASEESGLSMPFGETCYIDTHVHLDEVLTRFHITPPYEEDLRVARDRIFGPACEAVIAQFCDPAAFAPSLAVWPDLLRLPGVYGAMGIHPHHAKYYSDSLEERVQAALEHPKAVALGEIGLDFKANRSPKPQQEEVFRRQLRLGLALRRPMVLHSAHAEDRTLEILREEVSLDLRPVTRIHLHCFTGTRVQAASFLSDFPGLCIGLTGFITYDNEAAAEVRRALAEGVIPLTRLVLETDGPHMMPRERPPGSDPHPHAEAAAVDSSTSSDRDRGRGRGRGGGRGRGAASGAGGSPSGGRGGGGRGRGRDSGGGRGGGGGCTTPASIVDIALEIARVTETTAAEVIRITSRNARDLYGLPRPPTAE